ncbi:MAG TPA: electron transfer flavoprotein subunit alpha/FixB family protein [Nitriliruptorales bacterium]
MAETRALVIAPDEASADALLGLVPAELPTELVVLDVAADDLTPATRGLPADRIVAVPQLPATSDAEVAGPFLRERVASAQLVVLDSSQAGRDLAGWLAVTLDLPLVWAIDALRQVDGHLQADRVVLGGTYRLVHEIDPGTPSLVLGKPTQPASAQDRPRSAPAEVVEETGEAGVSRVRVLESPDGEIEGVPLAAARTVLSVGRGIGGPDNVDLFRQIAARAGAALGASRVAVDSGWVSFAHQVGQTGTAVAPDLYVAFGISGAIQHLAGMRGSGSIIAVNTDPEAPMCRLAEIVVNADAIEVAEGLLKRLANR